jgi:hypothetical protein
LLVAKLGFVAGGVLVVQQQEDEADLMGSATFFFIP